MAKLLLANPRKRKRVSRKRRTSVSTVSRKRVSRKYRRNPSARGTSVTQSVKRSFVGAIGALSVDLVTNQVVKFLPMEGIDMQGTTGALVKGAISIGLGYSVAKFGGKKKLGAELAEGGLTVAIYEMGRAQLSNSGMLDGMYSSDGLLGYDDGLLGYSGVARQFDPVM